MSFLDELKHAAIKDKVDYLGLENVIEKEILHHDILNVMKEHGLLNDLTFIGGTCLRLCYNSSRLSEDLDFAAGHDFKPSQVDGFENEIEAYLKRKYQLPVSCRKPVDPSIESGLNTSTWKITITKHAFRPDLPSQKMHIDICSIPAFDPQPRPVQNHYNTQSQITGLMLNASSQDEILIDKMIAFAYRSRRIKPRDAWDIAWLKQQQISQNPELLFQKLEARKLDLAEFAFKLDKNVSVLMSNDAYKVDFDTEMKRFLPSDVSKRTLSDDLFWPYLKNTIDSEVQTSRRIIEGQSVPTTFKM
ncbi:nucleotidyl transferase AbiEii/AbiGii toxin family protein [Shewanella intestini]|uniref:Nucleotidyl transferase AbiEii/AbiGii toxin family protein n=1 Tax=Shewanella intestini TaxID=2017544 RepID=A0ABS5I0E6_9GAMM|nr:MULTISPECIES: nucleotidyl transferase AbiEii/AbiGii toxin family protein [Shewanella]MBR9727496.1 nucleotidyl transferase AbiEii/AbiGii toxin family protein [Shewanella intestini]MRG35354.1 nucleotidyl transferase AbiEii/AbiGii toxin family protein [Shewanella sp. XMDDZSB0408]